MSTAPKAKKLTFVLATSLLKTIASMEADLAVVFSLEVSISVANSLLSLKYILCIHHPMRFKKDQAKIQALLDSGSEVNPITLACAARLGLKV